MSWGCSGWRRSHYAACTGTDGHPAKFPFGRFTRFIRDRGNSQLAPAPADPNDATPVQAPERPRDTGRHEAAAIATAVRQQLTELLDQVNRPDEHRLLVTEAAHRVKDAIAPLKVRWCTITADTDGDLTHGHHAYRPPTGMRRLIQARDGTCTFPTCRHRADTCDLDHTVPHQKAGPTCPCKHTFPRCT